MPSTTINRNSLEYRRCVGVFLVNKQGKVFVGQRCDRISDAWQMPQGGVEEGENIEQAALRELLEETGTNNVRFLKESKKWREYDIPDELVPRFWGGKYRGQTQKWFLAEFLGEDSEINLETEEPEFSEWKWIEPKDLPDSIVPFKRELYSDVLEEFRSTIQELFKDK